jgi:hypothetical protein
MRTRRTAAWGLRWIAVVTLASGSLASESWTSEVVDGSANTLDASAAFDLAGHPSVAYQDVGKQNSVLFASWNPGTSTWQRQVVESRRDGLSVTKLGYDPLGRPGIAYTMGGLKYAEWNGQRWVITLIDSTADGVGDLAFDSAGHPAAVYNGGNAKTKDLRLARRSAAGTWSVEIVASKAGIDYYYRQALAFDPDNAPVIAYNKNNAVFVARPGTAGWVSTLVQPGPSGFGSTLDLAFDPSGRALLAYTSESTPGSPFATFRVLFAMAERGSPTWSFEQVDQFGTVGVSLAVDDTGAPAIAYKGPGSREVRLARRTASGWTSATFASVRPDQQISLPSLAFDLGNPGVAWVVHTPVPVAAQVMFTRATP